MGYIPGQEDCLEKEIATHSNILVWEMQWKEEPGGLQSIKYKVKIFSSPFPHTNTHLLRDKRVAGDEANN